MSNANSNISPFSRAVVGAVRNLIDIQRSSPIAVLIIQAVPTSHTPVMTDKLSKWTTPESTTNMFKTTVLLEAPYRRDNGLKNSALLTIDLTRAVADEAIKRKDSIIVTYHPIIFRPLKSLTQSNTQQSTLLRLAQEGISVYSPHTAVDAATGGLNDWLVSVLTDSRGSDPSISIKSTSVITPVPFPPPGFESSGYGRILTFSTPQPLRTLVKRALNSLSLKGALPGLSVATPQSVPTGQRGEILISSVGICAGSGGSLLNGLKDVDLLFTGELSHHEALAATEEGRSVITVFHSNSERGFLEGRMKELLEVEVKKEIQGAVKAKAWGEGVGEEFEIRVSEVDRDPFEVKTLEGVDSW